LGLSLGRIMCWLAGGLVPETKQYMNKG